MRALPVALLLTLAACSDAAPAPLLEGTWRSDWGMRPPAKLTLGGTDDALTGEWAELGQGDSAFAIFAVTGWRTAGDSIHLVLTRTGPAAAPSIAILVDGHRAASHPDSLYLHAAPAVLDPMGTADFLFARQ